MGEIAHYNWNQTGHHHPHPDRLNNLQEKNILRFTWEIFPNTGVNHVNNVGFLDVDKIICLEFSPAGAQAVGRGVLLRRTEFIVGL